MNKIKSIFEQTLLITFGILVAISLEGLISVLQGEDLLFSWYMPGSAVVGGIACAVPSTLLLVDIFEKERKELILRIILHCITLYVVNSFLGWLFHWYTTLHGFVYVSISYFAVYVFAWAGSFLINRQEDKEINEALKNIRDEE